MKVVTVTLNPAIDQTVVVNHLTLGVVNRGQSMTLTAGGKGVNVASLLADYGLTVAVTGWLGQDNAELFEQLCAAKHIADHFIRVPGRTRTSVKLADVADQKTTDVNLPGLAPTPEALQLLWETVARLAETYDWFVFGGNLPPYTSSDLYAELITYLKNRGKAVALDTSHEALRRGLQAGPTLAKPNLDELAAALGRPLHSVKEVVQAVRQWMPQQLPLLVVSLGERGAVFMDECEAWLATPPAVKIHSTVGAGDAMLAGTLVAWQQGLQLGECARLGTAFSLAVITRPSRETLSTEAVAAYATRVTLTPIPVE
jgi:1-phosphofructokinase